MPQRIRFSPGLEGTGCGPGCKNSCCEPEPPSVITVFITADSGDCDCTKDGTVTYTDDENPDGSKGMWEGTVSFECYDDSGMVCGSESLAIKFWCNFDPCVDCDCSCSDWSVQINGGTTYRISDTSGQGDCCCGSHVGVGWVYFPAAPIGGATECNAVKIKFTWTIASCFSLGTLSPSNFCMHPVPTTLYGTLFHPCGTSTSITLTGGVVNCASGAPGDRACWSASGFDLFCRDRTDPSNVICNTCTPGSVTICNRLATNLHEGIPPACTDTPWVGDIDGTCYGELNTIGDDCSCPTCDGGAFEVTFGWTAIGECGDPYDDCYCNDSTIQSWGLEITSWCYNTCCDNFVSSYNFILDLGDGGPCASGVLTWEATLNQCGCLGQWVGVASLQCGSTTRDTSTFYIRMCCNCDIGCATTCDEGDFIISLDGGTTASDSGCCNATGDVGWFHFTNVAIGSAGACNGDTAHVTVWQDSPSFPKVALPPHNGTEGDQCEPPLPQELDLDISNTCGTVTSISLINGTTDCSDPDVFTEWHEAGTPNIDCWDGSVCNSVGPVQVLLQYTTSYTWRLIFTSCLDGSPVTVNISSINVTCPDCADVTSFQITGTIPGPTDGCSGDCDDDAGMNFTITQP